MARVTSSLLRVVKATSSAALRVAPSDDELLEGVIRRDRALGGELCRRMMPVVDGTLYRVLGRREQDHDDLVQASFEQIVLTLTRGKFAGECSLTTWASAITCKVALHAIRRRCVERRIFDESLDAERWSRQAAGLRRRSLTARRPGATVSSRFRAGSSGASTRSCPLQRHRRQWLQPGNRQQEITRG